MGKRGWFVTRGRDGDRTVQQALVGLEPLLKNVSGKTVLDVGCAEGLVGIELANRGATHVLGIDRLEDHINVARRLGVEQTEFLVANANSFYPRSESFDIVLLLAILHKLKDPYGAAQRLGAAAKSLVVVRLPPGGPVFVDRRSNNKPQNITRALEDIGFHLESDSRGTFDEWIGFYRRGEMITAPAPTAAVHAPAPPSSVGWPFPSWSPHPSVQEQQEQVLQPALPDIAAAEVAEGVPIEVAIEPPLQEVQADSPVLSEPADTPQLWTDLEPGDDSRQGS